MRPGTEEVYTAADRTSKWPRRASASNGGLCMYPVVTAALTPHTHTINAKHKRVQQPLQSHSCAHHQNGYPENVTGAEFPQQALSSNFCSTEGREGEGTETRRLVAPSFCATHESHEAKFNDVEQQKVDTLQGHTRPCLNHIEEETCSAWWSQLTADRAKHGGKPSRGAMRCRELLWPPRTTLRLRARSLGRLRLQCPPRAQQPRGTLRFAAKRFTSRKLECNCCSDF